MAYKQEQINPYNKGGEKKTQVEAMFDNIAPTYDLLNHLLSFGTDKGWRRKSVDSLKQYNPQKILDLACGTGDFTFLVADRLQPKELIGCDLSEGMLEVARRKASQQSSLPLSEGKGMRNRVSFERGDALALEYSDETFDAVTIAYGVRNFQDLDAGLVEMHRVLKTGGHLLIVELATPPHFPMKQLFWLYSHMVMATVGGLVSHDRKAWKYLPASMEAFPQAEIVEKILLKAGFSDVTFHRLTFGLCTMFLAEK